MELTSLLQQTDTKILLVVLDGLGGMADAEHDTELEEADSPNLDALAAESITGLLEPVGPGITPGSGPGHLALFGYDPEAFELGRGVLSAAGLDFQMQPGDIAARGNFCTMDADGRILDRRAGRISNERAQPLVERLQQEVRLDGAEVFFRLEAEHRVLVVLRGADLDPRVSDTDPQEVGVRSLEPQALDPAAKRTADLVAQLHGQILGVLRGEQAHAVLLRGFDTLRELPTFSERYGLRAATVAIYPMYRGVARLVGMDAPGHPHSLEEQVGLLRENWAEYDYFFMHHKATDQAGHDGDRPAKIAAIEALDGVVPELRALNPDVMVISGDHSSPTQLSGHSWHPVPTLLYGRSSGVDEVQRFGERWCARGLLGWRRTTDLMPLMLAAAGRLQKYGP
jgi:2,3-bisphosphoglycerate-independent phosphoglycerate mutase